RSNTPLSCKIEYYIKTNSAYFSDQSAFFTDDYSVYANINKRRKIYRVQDPRLPAKIRVFSDFLIKHLKGNSETGFGWMR
ncbi:hypothetical protein ABID65_009324, partial [Bradyrhizobium sp. S3.9.2]